MADSIPQNNTNTPIDNQEIISKIKPKQSIMDILDLFEPISLSEMDSVKLMNRIDTKYVISQNQLAGLLQKAVAEYRVVEVEGQRISPYSSIYFDTDDYQMYITHHNNKLNRQKVRMRSYLNSGISFLEIKNKNNKGRTSKKRIPIKTEQFDNIFIDDKGKDLIDRKTPFQLQDLSPSLHNYFYRITLVDKKKTERVTLDLNLTYRDLNNSELHPVQDIVVIELKQDGNIQSKFGEWLGEISALPMGMSKYCLGIIMTIPGIKYNRFKKKVLYINKITEMEQLNLFN